MVGELITLPVRLGVRATRLWLRVTEETVGLAVNAGVRVFTVTSRSRGAASEAAAVAPDSARRFTSSREPELDRIRQQAIEATRPRTEEAGTAALTLDAPAEAEPAHVSEEPALVEELAEPGAEEGAGAEVHVDEPWAGYGQLNAKEIVARLRSGSPAELAAVQLYEGSHRQRQTVLNAVQRELRNANGRSSRNQ